MTTIPLSQAFAILQNASAVIIDNNVLVYPSLDAITGDATNEFMYLGWDLGFSVKYAEEGNEQVKISGSSMFLINTDGDEDELTILVPANLG